MISDSPQTLHFASMQQAYWGACNIGAHGLQLSVIDVSVCVHQVMNAAAADIQGLLDKEIGASSFRW